MDAIINAISSFVSDMISRIQTYVTNLQDTRMQSRLQKIHSETTRPQWGDEKVFNQGNTGGATNIAPKKPAVKKEPLLK